jgi:hypothetical protein
MVILRSQYFSSTTDSTKHLNANNVCVCVCFCHGLTAFDLLVLAVRAVLDKVAQAAAINARLIGAAKLERRAFFALPHRCNERKKTPPPRQYIVVNDAHAHVRNRGCEIIDLSIHFSLIKESSLAINCAQCSGVI